MKEEIQNLSEEILEIEYKLNSYITSTLWVSDLHGEGKKFARIKFCISSFIFQCPSFL